MDTPVTQDLHSRIDRIGAMVSLACAIHCIALPFVITVLPFIGLGLLADHTFEIVMISIAGTLAVVSLCWGSKVHGQKRLLFFVAVALLLFVAGHIFFSGLHKAILVSLGGASLAIGHVINLKLCRSCKRCCSGH